jgi:superfamily II DNA/RNA helicase
MTTNYHAKYFAHEITKATSGHSNEKLSMSLFNASVDLNPHQVEAALFAFRSPLSKGVILADEVGLGKTIEAGLILCQYWAERKRNILVICPASLRKQWSLELSEKFNLPSLILESKSYKNLLVLGKNPFEQNNVVIVSFNFANKIKAEIRAQKWSVAVIDEAHKLRNVYRASNKTAQGIKFALEDTNKLLLTATPLQNSLMELYGLSTIISDHIFGDAKSFRAQYISQGINFTELRERISSFTKRTLRKDVLEYIKYTERLAITKKFEANNKEHELYTKLSEFLQREDTFAIPKSQRTLTTLVLRKLLASSTQAIIGTLTTIKLRLEAIKKDFSKIHEKILLDLDDDMQEIIDEEQDELEENEDFFEENKTNEDAFLKEKLYRIDKEIKEVHSFIDIAKEIKIDSKAKNLISAIEIGFSEMQKMGANRKAIIFTESRRTQDYLKVFLEEQGFREKIVLFNGTNSSKEATAIYKDWIEKNKDKGRTSDSITADKRNALIEYFRDTAEILIATESAAEGINLQFCSLVINYDLPWNPQRVEQRIGRCHRYGQQHDVVVINFLNTRNEADCHVYDLLKEKFKLFDGIFGSSDEVLGSIESGVDFEKKILAIYQNCRTTEQIEKAFSELQKEMDEKIQSNMEKAKKSILEHFDEDVHSRLKVRLDETKQNLNKLETMFWITTKVALKPYADFNDNSFSFSLYKKPLGTVLTGNYQMISKDKENIQSQFLYRLSHPLGEYVIDKAKDLNTEYAELVFDISNHTTKITVLEKLKNKSGYLILSKLAITSFDFSEHLLFNAICEDKNLDQEVCEKLFLLDCKVNQSDVLPSNIVEKLKKEAKCHADAIIFECQNNNNLYFIEESERLEKWAEDIIKSAEKELDDNKKYMRELKRQDKLAKTTAEKLEIQKQIRDAQAKQSRLRRDIFSVEDEINSKRDKLISELEEQMKEKTNLETLFMVKWKII